jgi:hypothetical protein
MNCCAFWTDGVAQVIQCLPSKHKAPNSNPSITKKKKEGKRWKKSEEGA